MIPATVRAAMRADRPDARPIVAPKPRPPKDPEDWSPFPDTSPLADKRYHIVIVTVNDNLYSATSRNQLSLSYARTIFLSFLIRKLLNEKFSCWLLTLYLDIYTAAIHLTTHDGETK